MLAKRSIKIGILIAVAILVIVIVITENQSRLFSGRLILNDSSEKQTCIRLQQLCQTKKEPLLCNQYVKKCLKPKDQRTKTTPVLAPSPITLAPSPSVIDEYITCPTQEEKNQIEEDFDIRFYNTTGSMMSWSDFPYQCDSTVFTNINPTRVKTYNVIRFLKNIQFSRPLPFTQGRSFYEFLTLQTVSNPARPKLLVEPHLECDIYSYGGLFVLTLGGNLARWYPVLSGSNTCELGFGPPSNMLVNDFAYHPLYAAELFVHEAYHAITNSFHTGTNGADATIEEMGAWAAQFYFNAWAALYSTNLDENTKQLARDNAISILQNRFTENSCPNDNALKEVVNQIVPNSCS